MGKATDREFREQAKDLRARLQEKLLEPNSLDPDFVEDMKEELDRLSKAENVAHKDRLEINAARKLLEREGVLDGGGDTKEDAIEQVIEWFEDHCEFFINQDDVPCFTIRYPSVTGHLFPETRYLHTIPSFMVWAVPRFIGKKHPIPSREKRNELLERWFHEARNSKPRMTYLRTGNDPVTGDGYLFRGKYGWWNDAAFDPFSDWIAYRVPAKGAIGPISTPEQLPEHMRFLIHDDVHPLELTPDLNPNVDFQKHFLELVNGDENTVRAFALSIQGYLRGEGKNKTGMYFHGELNSAKSSGLKALKRIFDYTKQCAEEAVPKDDVALFIKSTYNQILWFSNCTYDEARARRGTMNCLRRMQTDGGLGERRFFIQTEEHSAKAVRTVWLDGRDMVLRAGDERSRNAIIDIPVIGENVPARTDAQNEADFFKHGPKILGAVLRGWQIYKANPTKSPIPRYRNPDDAAMVTAASEVFGFTKESMVEWLRRKVRDDQEYDLATRPNTRVLEAFRNAIEVRNGVWMGRPGTLKRLLERVAAQERITVAFTSPKALRDWLYQRQTQLRGHGILVEFHSPGVDNAVPEKHIRLTYFSVGNDGEEEQEKSGVHKIPDTEEREPRKDLDETGTALFAAIYGEEQEPSMPQNLVSWKDDPRNPENKKGGAK